MFQPLAKANNPWLPEHKEDEETSLIMYLDANPLYPFRECKALPVDSYSLLELSVLQLLRFRPPYACSFHVSLDCCKKLYKQIHNN